MSEIYYVDTMLGRNNRSGYVAGDKPEFDKVLKEKGVLEQDSTSDLLDAVSYGVRKLQNDEVTKIYYLHYPLKRSLSDIFYISGGVFVVSLRLRQILEEFDPGLHQYFPIEIIQSNGKPVDDDYFILHITLIKDTVFMDQPAVETIRYQDIEMKSLDTMMAPIEPILVINGTSHQAGNIWRAKGFESYYFISKALHDRMAKDDIYFFKTYKTQLVCGEGA